MTKPWVRIATGALILIGLATISATAHWICQFNPNEMNLPDQFQPPSHIHWLGTDENGSDVFSKMVYGARVSLTVAIVVVGLSATIGLLVGSLAGFYGGVVDMIVSRVMDLIYAFPGFLLALSLVAVLGPSLKNLILTMSLTSWASFARLVRGEVYHLREREYVVSSRALGAGALRQVVYHVWPNLFGVLIVQSTFAMAGTIVAESSLSFLGLGVPSTTPTWGALLSSGRKFLSEAPYLSLVPGLAIVLLVFGFNLLGDGLRDHLDPRQQS